MKKKIVRTRGQRTGPMVLLIDGDGISTGDREVDAGALAEFAVARAAVPTWSCIRAARRERHG